MKTVVKHSKNTLIKVFIEKEFEKVPSILQPTSNVLHFDGFLKVYLSKQSDVIGHLSLDLSNISSWSFRAVRYASSPAKSGVNVTSGSDIVFKTFQLFRFVCLFLLWHFTNVVNGTGPNELQFSEVSEQKDKRIAVMLNAYKKFWHWMKSDYLQVHFQLLF